VKKAEAGTRQVEIEVHANQNQSLADVMESFGIEGHGGRLIHRLWSKLRDVRTLE
jgi:hypothetical protein